MNRALPLFVLVLLPAACGQSNPSSDAGSGGGGGGGIGGGFGGSSGGGAGGGAGGGGGSTFDAGRAAPDSGTLTGELAFPVQTIRSFVQLTQDGGVDLAQLVMMDVAVDLCANPPPPTMEIRGLNVAVGRSSADGGRPILPGTYELTRTSPFSPEGGADVARSDFLPDGGYRVYSQLGGVGTVTLFNVGAGAMEGTFSATLALVDGGSSVLSGSFNAPSCP